MVKLLIVSHGTLATSFKETVAMIAGEKMAAELNCLCMVPEKSPEEFEEEAKELLKEDPDGEYLIFADIFGASPCNTCISAFRSANYRMVTGMKLGVILEVLFQKDSLPLEELYVQALKIAKDRVRGVSLHL
jgi:mannose/fructose-specific phosphotransferase system component IIA